MIKPLKIYVQSVDSLNTVIAQIVKFLILVIIGILAYEAISRTVFNHPDKWALEITEFINGAYYLLGGGFVLLIGGHVRMDVFYERWSQKKKVIFDIITFVFSFGYLTGLLIGGINSTLFALKYGQKNYSAWGPPLAPMKIIATIGISLMLLQVISELIKDIAIASGEDTSWINRLKDRE
ncbi:TRAP transporter small permease subunit [Desulfomarina sp.]